MFKVICIDEDAFPEAIEYDLIDNFLKDGNVYMVEYTFTNHGYTFYKLIGAMYGYWEKCFAMCSDIDETEILSNRELDKIIDAYSYQDSI